MVSCSSPSTHVPPLTSDLSDSGNIWCMSTWKIYPQPQLILNYHYLNLREGVVVSSMCCCLFFKLLNCIFCEGETKT